MTLPKCIAMTGLGTFLGGQLAEIYSEAENAEALSVLEACNTLGRHAQTASGASSSIDYRSLQPSSACTCSGAERPRGHTSASGVPGRRRQQVEQLKAARDASISAALERQAGLMDALSEAQAEVSHAQHGGASNP